jgi:HEAT repeat protein
MPARIDRFIRRTAAILTIVAAVAGAGCGGQRTPDLIAQARSADGSERIHAIRAMGDRPRDAEHVVPVLVELLNDQDAFIRRDAALSLGRLGTKAEPAAAALRVAARDRNDHVRRAATEALKKIEQTVEAKR